MIRYQGIEFDSVEELVAYQKAIGELNGEKKEIVPEKKGIDQSFAKQEVKKHGWIGKKGWTNEDDTLLKKAVKAGKSNRQISRMLGRTQLAVALRLHNLRWKRIDLIKPKERINSKEIFGSDLQAMQHRADHARKHRSRALQLMKQNPYISYEEAKARTRMELKDIKIERALPAITSISESDTKVFEIMLKMMLSEKFIISFNSASKQLPSLESNLSKYLEFTKEFMKNADLIALYLGVPNKFRFSIQTKSIYYE